VAQASGGRGPALRAERARWRGGPDHGAGVDGARRGRAVASRPGAAWRGGWRLGCVTGARASGTRGAGRRPGVRGMQRRPERSGGCSKRWRAACAARACERRSHERLGRARAGRGAGNGAGASSAGGVGICSRAPRGVI
jgi:hypothetical protein